MLIIGLLVIGIFARFIPHAPNFTPVVAIALFGGIYLRKKQALILPLALLVISDIFIGFHPTIMFTWGSVLLISLIGLIGKEKRSWISLLTKSLLSAIVFFLVTNFGVWIMYHAHTWQGLVECYTLAIPFFRQTLLSTLVYAGVLFGSYELCKRQFPRLVKNVG